MNEVQHQGEDSVGGEHSARVRDQFSRQAGEYAVSAAHSVGGEDSAVGEDSGGEGHPARVRDQFSRQAGEYAVSAAHSSGESLDILERLASEGRHRWAVDVATGAGFTAFAAAPYCERVLATDISPGMVGETRRIASERGLGNVFPVFAAAESLPFLNGSLDLVTCRTAAHHFHRLEESVSEVVRVLRTGGAFLLADSCASEDATAAAWQHDVEIRRDPTHVRNVSPSEWRDLLERAGLVITFEALARVEMTFSAWTLRSGTPSDVCERLRLDWKEAPPEAVSEFRIIALDPDDFHFSWPVYVCRAIKPGHSE